MRGREQAALELATGRSTSAKESGSAREAQVQLVGAVGGRGGWKAAMISCGPCRWGRMRTTVDGLAAGQGRQAQSGRDTKKQCVWWRDKSCSASASKRHRGMRRRLCRTGRLAVHTTTATLTPRRLLRSPSLPGNAGAVYAMRCLQAVPRSPWRSLQPPRPCLAISGHSPTLSTPPSDVVRSPGVPCVGHTTSRLILTAGSCQPRSACASICSAPSRRAPGHRSRGRHQRPQCSGGQLKSHLSARRCRRPCSSCHSRYGNDGHLLPSLLKMQSPISVVV